MNTPEGSTVRPRSRLTIKMAEELIQTHVGRVPSRSSVTRAITTMLRRAYHSAHDEPAVGIPGTWLRILAKEATQLAEMFEREGF